VRADWISFYDSQYHLVVRFVMNNGASLYEAEDAASEAFTEAWRTMETKPGSWHSITSKQAWIRTVALRRYWRPPGPRTRPLIGAAAEVPDLPSLGPDIGDLAAQAQMVLQALRSLDEDARAVMAFRVDDFTTAEIADALDLTEQRVRDIEKRARRDLKRYLARNTEGSEQR
jgi:RNA polymerase sigma factor (sigma-70 family)